MKITIKILLFLIISNFSYTQWVQLPNGLGDTRIYSIAVNGNKIIAGTEGKGVFLTTDNGNNWEPIGLSPQSIGCVAFSGNNILAGTESSGVFLSSDNGKNWFNTLKYDMITTITSSSNIIFAGGFSGIYISTDNGNSWTKNESINSSIGNIVNIGNTVIASSPVGIYKSTDNGDNWVMSTTGLEPGEYFALGLSDKYLYASSGGTIYLSTDFGTNWTKKTNVKADIIFTLAVQGNNVFAGTLRENIFLSTDNGTSWAKKDKGLIGRTVKTLVINNENIFAATDAGVFRAKISDLITTYVTEDFENSNIFLISPNPAKKYIDISAISKDFNSSSENTKVELFNSLGDIVLSQTINLISDKVRLWIDFLPAGYYYLKFGNHFEKFVKF